MAVILILIDGDIFCSVTILDIESQLTQVIIIIIVFYSILSCCGTSQIYCGMQGIWISFFFPLSVVWCMVR